MLRLNIANLLLLAVSFPGLFSSMNSLWGLCYSRFSGYLRWYLSFSLDISVLTLSLPSCLTE